MVKESTVYREPGTSRTESIHVIELRSIQQENAIILTLSCQKQLTMYFPSPDQMYGRCVGILLYLLLC